MDASPTGSPFPALVADGTGRVLSANDAAKRATGRPLNGTNLQDLLPEPRRNWTALRHHVRGRGGAPLRITVLSADRRRVEVEVHVRPVTVRTAFTARAVQLI